MTTSRDISDSLNTKPLGKWGSASVQRIQIRPVTVKPVQFDPSMFSPGSPASAEKAAGTDQ